MGNSQFVSIVGKRVILLPRQSESVYGERERGTMGGREREGRGEGMERGREGGREGGREKWRSVFISGVSLF